MKKLKQFALEVVELFTNDIDLDLQEFKKYGEGSALWALRLTGSDIWIPPRFGYKWELITSMESMDEEGIDRFISDHAEFVIRDWNKIYARIDGGKVVEVGRGLNEGARMFKEIFTKEILGNQDMITEWFKLKIS